MARRSFRVAAVAAALALFAPALRAEDRTDLVGRVRLVGPDKMDVALVTSSGTYDLRWRPLFNTWVRAILFGQDGSSVKLAVTIEEPAAPGKHGRAYAHSIYGRAKKPLDVIEYVDGEKDKTVGRVVDHLKEGEVVALDYRFLDNLVRTERGAVGWVKRYDLDFDGFTDRKPAKPSSKPAAPERPTAGLIEGLGR